MARRRIGILGGTFDPPHHGHLIVATEAREVLGAEKLLFVPSRLPPHKPAGAAASADQRLRMLQAALAGEANLEVDDLELRREGPSYTVDTLRELRLRYPDAELVFLLGIDQFRVLHTWREPREVATLATLGVLARGGETAELNGPYGGMHVPVSRIDISATSVRERAAAGKSIRYYVPDAVVEIIERERLYIPA